MVLDEKSGDHQHYYNPSRGGHERVCLFKMSSSYTLKRDPQVNVISYGTINMLGFKWKLNRNDSLISW